MPNFPIKTNFKELVHQNCNRKIPKHNPIDGNYDHCTIDDDFCDMSDCPIIERYFTKKEPKQENSQ